MWTARLHREELGKVIIKLANVRHIQHLNKSRKSFRSVSIHHMGFFGKNELEWRIALDWIGAPI